MNSRLILKMVVTGIVALAAVTSVGAAPTLGKNLVKNPGAEAGPGAPSTGTTIAPPRWTATGNVTAAQYGGSGFPTTTSPGPEKRGVNLFAGGSGTAGSSMEQRINVGALSDQINTGNIGYSLAAYLGGAGVQDDRATVDVTFADVEGNALGSDSLPAVLAADRGNVTGTIRRKARGLVPVNTRYILVTVTFTWAEGTYSNGYAEALSLILNEQ